MARRSPHPPLIPIALATALGAAGGCGGTARGPPIALHTALATARRALCADGGVESPRALVEAVGAVAPCASAGLAERVRCYLDRPDTTFEVARVRDGVSVRVAIPQLSDHVHEVRVRGRGGALVVEIESAN